MTEIQILEELSMNIKDALNIVMANNELNDFKLWINNITEILEVSGLSSNSLYNLLKCGFSDISLEEFMEELLELDIEIYVSNPNVVRKVLSDTFNISCIDKKLSNYCEKSLYS